MAGCYAAAAANAKEVGARSGVVGQAVFSCTARGRVSCCSTTITATGLEIASVLVRLPVRYMQRRDASNFGMVCQVMLEHCSL
jgi:hypothetical protein